MTMNGRRPPPLSELLRARRSATVVTVLRERGTARWTATVAMSQNELAHRAGLDASLINYLERGETRTPRRDTVLRLAAALELGPFGTAELLVAAGYWPWPDLDVEQLGVMLGAGLAIADGDYRPLQQPAPVDRRTGARLGSRG
jgi:transcriptional regulator with XRE-family HTH domain